MTTVKNYKNHGLDVIKQLPNRDFIILEFVEKTTKKENNVD